MCAQCQGIAMDRTDSRFGSVHCDEIDHEHLVEIGLQHLGEGPVGRTVRRGFSYQSQAMLDERTANC